MSNTTSAALKKLLLQSIILLNQYYIILRRVRLGDRKASKTSRNEVNVQNMQYTDLQEHTRGARDYTELQTRTDDYSNIDADGHAYFNTPTWRPIVLPQSRIIMVIIDLTIRWFGVVTCNIFYQQMIFVNCNIIEWNIWVYFIC